MSNVKKKSVVQPTVVFENDTKEHALDVALNSKNPPTIKSVGMFRIPGTNNYTSFVMTTKGTEVVSIEVEQPNLRGIAEESAKISFVDCFMSGEGND